MQEEARDVTGAFSDTTTPFRTTKAKNMTDRIPIFFDKCGYAFEGNNLRFRDMKERTTRGFPFIESSIHALSAYKQK